MAQAAVLFAGRDTLSVALMVVTCEALKPADKQYRDQNISHAVEAFARHEPAKPLHVGWFRAQNVRSSHLHPGEFHGPEYLDGGVHSPVARLMTQF